MKLTLKVIPGAAQTQIVGWLGDTLKIRVAAPPERGKANQAVESAIATALNVPRDQVQIIQGYTSTRKVLAIQGLDPQEIRQRLSKIAT